LSLINGERNEALDTFVYAQAALHGLISMGLRLNEKCHGTIAGPRIKGNASDDLQKVIPSPWLALAKR
jgi:phage terminase large subunit GpA-like protein